MAREVRERRVRMVFECIVMVEGRVLKRYDEMSLCWRLGV